MTNHMIDATYYFIVILILNMSRALLCPSSEARDYNADYHIGRFILGLL